MKNFPSSAVPRRLVLLGLASVAAAGCSPEGAKALPEASLPPISGLKTATGWDVPGVDTSKLRGQVTVLNIWASWCPYCRGEHDVLKSLSGDGRFKLVGLVHRDSAANARDYLKTAGNPYAAISVDENNRLGNAVGQRGVPNTYVIGRDLGVVMKIGGALDPSNIQRLLFPAVENARAG